MEAELWWKRRRTSSREWCDSPNVSIASTNSSIESSPEPSLSTSRNIEATVVMFARMLILIARAAISIGSPSIVRACRRTGRRAQATLSGKGAREAGRRAGSQFSAGAHRATTDSGAPLTYSMLTLPAAGAMCGQTGGQNVGLCAFPVRAC